ncbi:hypothetical protein BV20DRAFT_1074950 [Pilatotrama ljubarskyi]|nr:hypothetical protein BV20DRAFT_1074950 [Pilatotrama ljubarskyi]
MVEDPEFARLLRRLRTLPDRLAPPPHDSGRSAGKDFARYRKPLTARCKSIDHAQKLTLRLPHDPTEIIALKGVRGALFGGVAPSSSAFEETKWCGQRYSRMQNDRPWPKIHAQTMAILTLPAPHGALRGGGWWSETSKASALQAILGSDLHRIVMRPEHTFLAVVYCSAPCCTFLSWARVVYAGLSTDFGPRSIVLHPAARPERTPCERGGKEMILAAGQDASHGNVCHLFRACLLTNVAGPSPLMLLHSFRGNSEDLTNAQTLRSFAYLQRAQPPTGWRGAGMEAVDLSAFALPSDLTKDLHAAGFNITVGPASFCAYNWYRYLLQLYEDPNVPGTRNTVLTMLYYRGCTVLVLWVVMHASGFRAMGKGLRQRADETLDLRAAEAQDAVGQRVTVTVSIDQRITETKPKTRRRRCCTAQDFYTAAKLRGGSDLEDSRGEYDEAARSILLQLPVLVIYRVVKASGLWLQLDVRGLAEMDGLENEHIYWIWKSRPMCMERGIVERRTSSAMNLSGVDLSEHGIQPEVMLCGTSGRMNITVVDEEAAAESFLCLQIEVTAISGMETDQRNSEWNRSVTAMRIEATSNEASVSLHMDLNPPALSCATEYITTKAGGTAPLYQVDTPQRLRGQCWFLSNQCSIEDHRLFSSALRVLPGTTRIEKTIEKHLEVAEHLDEYVVARLSQCQTKVDGLRSEKGYHKQIGGGEAAGLSPSSRWCRSEPDSLVRPELHHAEYWQRPARCFGTQISAVQATRPGEA